MLWNTLKAFKLRVSIFEAPLCSSTFDMQPTPQSAIMLEKHPSGVNLQVASQANRLDRCNQPTGPPPRYPSVSLNVRIVTQGDQSQFGSSPPRSARQLVQDKLGRRYSEVSLKLLERALKHLSPRDPPFEWSVSAQWETNFLSSQQPSNVFIKAFALRRCL